MAIQASVFNKIAFGPRAGRMVCKIGKGFGYREEIALAKGRQCASINGFNLHAATYVSPLARHRLENLISYLTRPLVAVERLTRRDDGDMVYRMKRRFADGSEVIVLSPSELLERLSAMAPPPRAHQILYTGVFSSHCRWREQVVEGPSACKGFGGSACEAAGKQVKNHRWAKLLMRIFRIVVGARPHCGADMLIRAAIQEAASIACYLRHIGLSAHPPPIASARYEQGSLAWSEEILQAAPAFD